MVNQVKKRESFFFFYMRENFVWSKWWEERKVHFSPKVGCQTTTQKYKTKLKVWTSCRRFVKNKIFCVVKLAKMERKLFISFSKNWTLISKAHWCRVRVCAPMSKQKGFLEALICSLIENCENFFFTFEVTGLKNRFHFVFRQDNFLCFVPLQYFVTLVLFHSDLWSYCHQTL